MPNRKATTAHKYHRVFKALARSGLIVERDEPVFRVRQQESNHAPPAEILLPAGFPLESKAVAQLASFAAATHPAGGSVVAAFATPDFHPGTAVPVGAVVATSPDMVIPQAIGTDIQCGMRLHVADLGIERFLAGKSKLVELLKGDLLLGTRDLPMRVASIKAIFEGGCIQWLDEVCNAPLGRLVASDMARLERELGRVYGMASLDGESKWAPSNMISSRREVVRDPSLASVGGGNHFVEFRLPSGIGVQLSKDTPRRRIPLHCVCAMEKGSLSVDRREATMWLRRAAAQGHSTAHLSLGYAHFNGEGVRYDRKKSLRLYRQAAKAGEDCAMFNLGQMYRCGDVVTQNWKLAIQWYQRAAELGNVGAANWLGTIYGGHKDLPEKPELAVKWHTVAAKEGDADSQCDLGVHYFNGESIAVDGTEVLLVVPPGPFAAGLFVSTLKLG